MWPCVNKTNLPDIAGDNHRCIDRHLVVLEAKQKPEMYRYSVCMSISKINNCCRKIVFRSKRKKFVGK